MPRNSPLRAILFVVIAITLLLVGGVFTFLALGTGLSFGDGHVPFTALPITPVNGVQTVIGVFMLTFGIVVILAIAGVFEGAPYHGGFWTRARAVMKADEELERREEERYSD